MSIQKVLEMAEKFVTIAEEGTVMHSPGDEAYKSQRGRLSQFYDHFTTQLRRIINEMSGDLFTLKNREFDAKTFKMFAKAYNDLISISKEIKEDKPYIAAEKLVHHVLNGHNSNLLNNLDFLAKQHIKDTNIDFKPSQFLKHPDIHSIDNLKALATHLKSFMLKNPLIVPPGQSEPPPMRLPENVEPLSEIITGPGEKTKPGSPDAKKK